MAINFNFNPSTLTPEQAQALQEALELAQAGRGVNIIGVQSANPNLTGGAGASVGYAASSVSSYAPNFMFAPSSVPDQHIEIDGEMIRCDGKGNPRSDDYFFRKISQRSGMIDLTTTQNLLQSLGSTGPAIEIGATNASQASYGDFRGGYEALTNNLIFVDPLITDADDHHLRQDGLSYLATFKEGNQGRGANVVMAAHLPSDIKSQFLSLVGDALEPGGVLVFKPGLVRAERTMDQLNSSLLDSGNFTLIHVSSMNDTDYGYSNKADVFVIQRDS